MTTEAPAKLRPGRKKGMPKVAGSGRPKGSPNKVTRITRDFIIKKGAPIDVLCKIAQGQLLSAAVEPGSRKREKVYPTLDQRKEAARILAPMVVPNLKAIEITGADGGPVKLSLLDFLAGLPE